jgi:hypothetical protein
MITVTALHAGRLSFRDRSPREGAVSNDVACEVCWEGPQDGRCGPLRSGLRVIGVAREASDSIVAAEGSQLPAGCPDLASNERVLDARTRDALTTQRIAL